MTTEQDTAPDAASGQVAAAAAEVYDAFFVPALFAQWTDPVLDAAGVRAGDRVLDVGCGTGVLARAAAARVGAGGAPGAGAVIGLDRNPGMLAVARRAPEPVTWAEGVAERLPFPDGHVDRVVSQFAVMFFDDPAAALAEMARVLVPGGTVGVATWCSVDQSPGYAAMVGLLRDVVGAAAAAALLAPFSLGVPATLAGLLAASFDDIDVARVEGTARFASLEAWVHTDIRGWTLATMVDDAAEARILAAAREVLAEWVAADGSVRFPAPALVARAVRRG